MLIIGGENIYPQDIEAILNEQDYLDGRFNRA